jgi:hypothetical protein
VIAVIVPNLATTLITFLALPRVDSLMRMLLAMGLVYALYRGKPWARNLLVILYGIAILFSLATVDFTSIAFDFWPLFMAGLPVIHVASVVILTAFPAVGHFLYFQRNGHPRNYHDHDDDQP